VHFGRSKRNKESTSCEAKPVSDPHNVYWLNMEWVLFSKRGPNCRRFPHFCKFRILVKERRFQGNIRIQRCNVAFCDLFKPPSQPYLFWINNPGERIYHKGHWYFFGRNPQVAVTVVSRRCISEGPNVTKNQLHAKPSPSPIATMYIDWIWNGSSSLNEDQIAVGFHISANS
jgi:hypothetical protein